LIPVRMTSNSFGGCNLYVVGKRKPIESRIITIMFREDAVTPVAHAANGLDAACPMRWWDVWGFDAVTKIKMEALPKLLANLMPLIPVRMTSNSFGGCNLYVVGKRKPIESPETGVGQLI